MGHYRLAEIDLPMLQRYIDRLAGDGLAAQTLGCPLRPSARSTGARTSWAR
jgi:hypothetical protein